MMVDGPDGAPLDVGRKTRRIPTRLRRAVLARDGVCVFPGCARPITEIHHRKHWVHGGATNLANLDGHCKFHHRTRGLTISPNTCVLRSYGDPLELDWTIAGLCEARERAAP